MNIARRRHRRGEGELLRDEILDAADDLLLETGRGDAVSIRAIEKRVGVTAPSIYRHFADKSELLYECGSRHFAALEAAMVEAIDGIEDPIEQIAACGRAYVHFGLENPGPYRIMFMTDDPTSGQSPDVGKVLGGAFGIAIDCATRAIQAGAIPGNPDPFMVSVGLWVAVHGVTSLFIMHGMAFPLPDVDAVLDHVMTTLIAGLRAGDG